MNPSFTPSAHRLIKHFSILLLCISAAFQSQARLYRINNIHGVKADFIDIYDALGATNVQSGDTLYLEPSRDSYNIGSISLVKKITFIGPGYFMDPANDGNAGFQTSIYPASIAFMRLSPSAAGSKFLGVTISGSLYLNGAPNITFEKVSFASGLYFEDGANDATTFRKCFFYSGIGVTASGTASITNLTIENSIFHTGAYITLPNLSGTGNLFRNNTIYNNYNIWDLENCYFANNIVGSGSDFILTNSTVRNNIFLFNQTLPGTATDNLVNQDFADIFVGGSGSMDARLKLAPGSIAIGKGMTIGAVVNPDCGAFGGTDPYIISGIPNIPSIYSLTVPTSIPTGTATMNITFSTKNN